MGNGLFACCCRSFADLLLWVKGEDLSDERSPLLSTSSAMTPESPPQAPAEMDISEATQPPVFYPDIIPSSSHHEYLQSGEVDQDVSSGNSGEKTSKAFPGSCQLLSIVGLLQPSVLVADLVEESTLPPNYSQPHQACLVCAAPTSLVSVFEKKEQAESPGSNNGGDTGSEFPAVGSFQCQKVLMLGKAASSGPALTNCSSQVSSVFTFENQDSSKSQCDPPGKRSHIVVEPDVEDKGTFGFLVDPSIGTGGELRLELQRGARPEIEVASRNCVVGRESLSWAFVGMTCAAMQGPLSSRIRL